MSDLNPVRTSLEVGFSEAEFPERFLKYRGREFRAIPNSTAFPYEDRQFEVVMLHAHALSPVSVKEAHRVLKPAGRLLFSVLAKRGDNGGLALSDIYKLVREGFDIVDVHRPHWWQFGFGSRDLTICARKKNWKTLNNTYRPYV